MALKDQLIKLAYDKPELRDDLLPLLRKAEKSEDEESEKEYMLTQEDPKAKDVIEEWGKDQAIGLAKEYLEKFGEPDYVEETTLTWKEVNDDQGTLWNQLVVKDMAFEHKDHKDSVLGLKHIDFPESAREDIHKVEGVSGTPGTWVVLSCGSTTGLNKILKWVKKQIEPHLENDDDS